MWIYFLSAVLIVTGLFDFIVALAYFALAAFQLVFGVIPSVAGWIAGLLRPPTTLRYPGHGGPHEW